MLQVRKSKTTTNSVSHAVDSGIQYLESGFLDSVFLCLYSGYQSPGFDSTSENFPDSGFHLQKFPGSQGIHGATFCKYKICSSLRHSKGRSKRNTWTTYLRCPLTSVVVVIVFFFINFNMFNIRTSCSCISLASLFSVGLFSTRPSATLKFLMFLSFFYHEVVLSKLNAQLESKIHHTKRSDSSSDW